MRQNSQGNIYGLTYTNFRSKCVFNGSVLGKEYSAKGIMDRLKTRQNHEELDLGQRQTNGLKQENNMDRDHKQDQEQSQDRTNNREMSNVLELLLKPEQNDNHLPYELLKKKRKKQSRVLHL